VLYALAHPLSLLVLLLSYVLGVTLHGWVQSLVADRVHDRRPRAEHRLTPDPRRHLDPFGAVAAAISGLGWAKPVELLSRNRRGAAVAVALSGPLVNLALGVGVLIGYRFAYGASGGGSGAATLLQQGTPIPTAALTQVSVLLLGLSQLYLGALSLVPLPPLSGGRLLFALRPQTLGWQKAEYHLVERNIGLVVLLVLLILPLGGPLPLLPRVLDSILTPLLNVILG
jgi:membrane-associated protease RseP (regulator of RpoE activity)